MNTVVVIATIPRDWHPLAVADFVLVYVLTKRRLRDFGFITPAHASAIRRPPAPIWLPVGIAGARGYGNLHCESNESRMKQVRGAGFPYFADFCEHVAGGFVRICDARRGDLALVRPTDGYDFHLILRLKDDADFGIRWEIVTGVPSRVCRDPVLWP